METPIIPTNYDESKKKNIIIKKEYNLDINNNKYNLIITLDNEFIEFKVYQLNDIKFIYYKNKFNLNNINNILDLSLNIYNNLEKVLQLIDLAYKNKNLLINIDINNKMNLIIRYQIGFMKHECLIPLIEKELDINEKFEIIFNEIILLKKLEDRRINEKIKNIEKLLLDIKTKFEENLNIINLLKNEVVLDLNSKRIGNDEIKYLKYLKDFKELKELNLYKNNISDISVLENVKFEKLEKLNLGWNEISNNINILKNVNFKELKVLDLKGNNISDISVLEDVKFEKLEKLYLGTNKISNNINILKIIYRI